MSKFYTIHGNQSPLMPILAYRGTEEDNKLSASVPSDDKAFNRASLPSGTTDDAVRGVIGHLFGSMVLMNLSIQVLCRVSDGGNLVAWVTDREA